MSWICCSCKFLDFLSFVPFLYGSNSVLTYIDSFVEVFIYFHVNASKHAASIKILRGSLKFYKKIAAHLLGKPREICFYKYEA